MQAHDWIKAAALALPVDDEDFGTDRQVDAENAFFGAIEEHLPILWLTIDAETEWLKATVEERVAEALLKVLQVLS